MEPEVNYRVHKSLPLVRILNQMSCPIYYLPSTPWCFK